jgi:putative two-component system hydrogenase maturation factor HypX/HoxX
MRLAKKSSIYRKEVTEGAMECLLELLEDKVEGIPQKEGELKPKVGQELRKIDWQEDSTEHILRKVYASEGQPGALATLEGQEYYIFDVHPEEELKGKPGELLAYRNEAVCIGTKDGALWVGYMREKQKHSIKLPALRILPKRVAEKLKEEPIKPWEDVGFKTYREIIYKEEMGLGLIYFNFYNGAMSAGQCERLLEVVRDAKSRPLKAIVLLGGEDFFSNGMNLNTIEASDSPADESWRNINAMDDLCEELLTTLEKLTLAGLKGNAGAGGFFLALSCDLIFAREGVVLNPHYKNIGNLYGSEFWTYTLPKRLGWEGAKKLMENRMPISSRRAYELGLIDGVFGKSQEEFEEKLKDYLKDFVNSPEFEGFLARRKGEKLRDWSLKPLSAYREEELQRMKLNFYGFDTSYHIARYYFVRRFLPFRTPPYLAVHRRLA